MSEFSMFEMVPLEQHLAFHWGMLMSVYPFFTDLVTLCGKMLMETERASGAELLDKMRELYGDRRIVTSATQLLVRSMIIWGMLKETTQKRVFRGPREEEIENQRLMAFLLEAYLRSRDDENPAVTVDEFLKDPAFYPFEFYFTNTRVMQRFNPRIKVDKNDKGVEMISLL